MRAINELVDGLDKVLVQFLALLVLLRPVVCGGLGVDTVYLLVILYERLNRVRRELVPNFVPQDHIHVDNISLHMKELVVEQSLDKGV